MPVSLHTKQKNAGVRPRPRSRQCLVRCISIAAAEKLALAVANLDSALGFEIGNRHCLAEIFHFVERRRFGNFAAVLLEVNASGDAGKVDVVHVNAEVQRLVDVLADTLAAFGVGD